MNIAIIIPARYGSTRFPGKPLAMIGEQTMLARVVSVARAAAGGDPNIRIAVTTDDERIAAHARDIGAECLMTSPDCATGSDRVYQAARQMTPAPDFVINLQGDTPFTPPLILTRMIEEIRQRGAQIEVITPVHQLSWVDLDSLRENKKTTPFSGTTCVRGPEGRALWFSKQIIPAIRKEDRSQELSPVFQHIGIYGFAMKTLERFVNLPPSYTETLEGLEQLRMLENGLSIQTILIDESSAQIHSGIDTPEDLKRAEKLLV
jgi:3-deoxy-manno-octulosonate cytidylyltransferase (CMP-KDO synthetase)